MWSSVLAPVGEIFVISSGPPSWWWSGTASLHGVGPPPIPGTGTKNAEIRVTVARAGRGWLWGAVSRSSPRSPSTTWAGRLGQPFAAVAGVTAQPIEHGVHAQVALWARTPLACSMMARWVNAVCICSLRTSPRRMDRSGQNPDRGHISQCLAQRLAGLAQDRRDHDVSLIPAFFSTWTVSRSAEQGKRPTSRLGMFGCSGPKRVPLTACRNEPCAGFR